MNTFRFLYAAFVLSLAAAGFAAEPTPQELFSEAVGLFFDAKPPESARRPVFTAQARQPLYSSAGSMPGTISRPWAGFRQVFTGRRDGAEQVPALLVVGPGAGISALVE